MSERELQRVEVLTDVVRGRRSATATAAMLEISLPQAHRLLCRLQRVVPVLLRTRRVGVRPIIG
jgi:hypothetical protein